MYRFLAPLFVPSVVLVLSVAYYMESLDVAPIDKILIKPVCLLILAFYLYFVIVEIFHYKTGKFAKSKGVAAFSDTQKPLPIKEVVILCMTALYVWVIQYLGFVLTSILFMGSMLYILNVRKTWIIVGFSVVSSAVLYLAFKIILMVPLPSGIFGF